MELLHDRAHATGWARDVWRDAALREAFRGAQATLSDGPPAVPGRLKRSLLGPYFRWTGVEGRPALDGQIFAIFIIVLAAAEAAVALAIFLNYYNNFSTIDVERAQNLKG